jgi:hypothetical protein
MYIFKAVPAQPTPAIKKTTAANIANTSGNASISTPNPISIRPKTNIPHAIDLDAFAIEL